MDEQKKQELAKATYATLCQALDAIQWRYKKDEEKLVIACGVSSEDLPVDLVVQVDKDRSMVLLLSKLPFSIREDRRLDMAVAVAALNNRLVHGCFDYHLTDGVIYFRLPNSFIDSVLDKEVFVYMLACATSTIDDYNDKLMMLAKGMVTLERFLELLDQK